MRSRQHISLADQNAAASVKFRSIRWGVGKEPKPKIRTRGLCQSFEIPLTLSVLNERQPWVFLNLRLRSVFELPLDTTALGGQQRML